MMNKIHGEPSFSLATPEVTFHITARGGHLAPVIFHLPGRDVSPYSLAPWQPGEFPDIPPLLSVLRGDFLCLPFGGQQDGPPHGDPANASWSLLRADKSSLRLRLGASDSDARIEKIIGTEPGQQALYCEHRISNLSGDFSYGTHPILDLSKLPEGTGRISVSPFRWASTFPGAFARQSEGERQSLAEAALFRDLHEVPLATGGTTDLTRYPARPGYEDLVMMANVSATPEQPFAWSAAVLDGYLWFSLKNPSDFPATLLWISNGGRSATPWNSRHLGRIGIEEVCSHFSNGVEVSRTSPLAAEGIGTTRRFSPKETVSLRVIQGVAAVPSDFGAVARITPDTVNSIVIIDEFGKKITIPLNWNFILQK